MSRCRRIPRAQRASLSSRLSVSVPWACIFLQLRGNQVVILFRQASQHRFPILPIFLYEVMCARQGVWVCANSLGLSSSSQPAHFRLLEVVISGCLQGPGCEGSVYLLGPLIHLIVVPTAGTSYLNSPYILLVTVVSVLKGPDAGISFAT